MKIKRDQIKKRQETSNKEISKKWCAFYEKLNYCYNNEGPPGAVGTSLDFPLDSTRDIYATVLSIF
jgi:hypothetical protein